jgi:hypothetical protein
VQRAAFSGPAPEDSLVIAPIQTDKFLVALAIQMISGEYEPKQPDPRTDISETARVILDVGLSLAKILHTVIENGITDPEGKEQYPPEEQSEHCQGTSPIFLFVEARTKVDNSKEKHRSQDLEQFIDQGSHNEGLVHLFTSLCVVLQRCQLCFL